MPRTFPILALIILHPRNHLRPKQTESVGHPAQFLPLLLSRDMNWHSSMELLISMVYVISSKALRSSVWDIVNPQYMLVIYCLSCVHYYWSRVFPPENGILENFPIIPTKTGDLAKIVWSPGADCWDVFSSPWKSKLSQPWGLALMRSIHMTFVDYWFFWGIREKLKCGSLPLGQWGWGAMLVSNCGSVEWTVHLRPGESWTENLLAIDIFQAGG